MKNKEPESFEYLGQTFKPLETLKGTWIEKSKNLWGNPECLQRINFKGYTWEGFYKEARKHGCSKIDVFELCGEKVIPCNLLMYYGKPSWYANDFAKQSCK